jgi:hypothetical protein
MGKIYMHFQHFLRETLPALKYIRVLPLKHYVIPYPADTPHPSLLEKSVTKKKEKLIEI